MRGTDSLLQARHTSFTSGLVIAVCDGGWPRRAEMVFLGGEARQLPLPQAQHLRRQGGELPPAGRQLYTGYGPATASVSANNIE